MDDEYEAMDAAWHQQEQDERRRREEEAIARCRPIADRFKQEWADFETEILNPKRNIPNRTDLP